MHNHRPVCVNAKPVSYTQKAQGDRALEHRLALQGFASQERVPSNAADDDVVDGNAAFAMCAAARSDQLRHSFEAK